VQIQSGDGAQVAGMEAKLAEVLGSEAFEQRRGDGTRLTFDETVARATVLLRPLCA
jgi:hypothetical protein